MSFLRKIGKAISGAAQSVGRDVQQVGKQAGDVLKKVEHAVAEAAKAVLHGAEEVVLFLPIEALKPAMKAALQKKGINPPGDNIELAKSFYANVVMASHFETFTGGKKETLIHMIHVYIATKNHMLIRPIMEVNKKFEIWPEELLKKYLEKVKHSNYEHFGHATIPTVRQGGFGGSGTKVITGGSVFHGGLPTATVKPIGGASIASQSQPTFPTGLDASILNAITAAQAAQAYGQMGGGGGSGGYGGDEGNMQPMYVADEATDMSAPGYDEDGEIIDESFEHHKRGKHASTDKYIGDGYGGYKPNPNYKPHFENADKHHKRGKHASTDKYIGDGYGGYKRNPNYKPNFEHAGREYPDNWISHFENADAAADIGTGAAMALGTAVGGPAGAAAGKIAGTAIADIIKAILDWFKGAHANHAKGVAGAIEDAAINALGGGGEYTDLPGTPYIVSKRKLAVGIIGTVAVIGIIGGIVYIMEEN